MLGQVFNLLMGPQLLGRWLVLPCLQQQARHWVLGNESSDLALLLSDTEGEDLLHNQACW